MTYLFIALAPFGFGMIIGIIAMIGLVIYGVIKNDLTFVFGGWFVGIFSASVELICVIIQIVLSFN